MDVLIISIHALRGEGDFDTVALPLFINHFNPRPPWGGRRSRPQILVCYLAISIHALRGEGDYVLPLDLLTTEYFNPRPPWGGRPPQNFIKNRHYNKISIHALRGEGDETTSTRNPAHLTFQSTPSVGRATSSNKRSNRRRNRFQSTPSVGRATL